MAELEMHDLLNLEKCDLSDKSGAVSVDIINRGGEFSSILKDIPAEKNLIAIAVKNYLHKIRKSGSFVFGITKNIPSGAGLGGGSSNAASALMLVSSVLGRESDGDLHEAAASTGSDVPFFLSGGFAFVEGRGESVTPVDFYDESYIIMVNNGIHINTGSAYQSLKKPVSDTVISCIDRKKLIMDKIETNSAWREIFRNDFEESVFGLYPEIGLIKNRMYQNGAFFASMTGSGSTVFGLFYDELSAKNVQKTLENDGNRVYFTKFRSKKN